MTTKQQISHKFSTVDFLGTDTDNILDVDFDKSVERYAELLQADIQAEYPDAEVEVEWTDDSLMHDIDRIHPWEPYEAGYDDVMDDIQRIKEDLYGNFERWIVEGFNTQAWIDKIGLQADKADTGDILTVTVGEAGPMESQDAMVEIVVLDAGQANGTVAYRYSTNSQDDNWQMGTVEQAVEHAADCYQAIRDAEQDTEGS